ncbi:transcriptional regulator MtlR [Halolactibacillus miurensis]|uniref:Mannitol operon transcriptional antiterminator n=1 Tax=Halolactibacillus miurensis TaxID=306541 RepID=A0A1I6TYK6_9BACI|nr:BglG family transcription antiterminator [Halolactibacillus miurensis]GEM04851.1 transcriptional regulator MtlR [Halolactibacillus miurensis]SFS94272.1 mannitol operon transcriptional antiterminator [Halolactibacillus miurensis]
MYISGRERRILEELLAHPDGLTVESMAQTLDVSTRTIHRDLKIVEDILTSYDLALDKKSGVGIHITGAKEAKAKLDLALTQVAFTDYTPEERQAIILTTLLETNGSTKLIVLANELNVTVATVSNDLDKVEDVLTEHNLELVRKRGYGVELIGKESDKRATLSYLIFKYVDELDFLTHIKSKMKTQSSTIDTVSERLLGLVDQSKLITIEKSINYIKSDLPYEFADSSYIGLVVHLALAIERLQKGEQIYFDHAYLEELKRSKEYAVAEKIILSLSEAFELEIPKDEIGYITMHLLGAKLRSDKGIIIEESAVNVLYLTKQLIVAVGEKINATFVSEDRLLKDLLTHLKPTLYRIQKGMYIGNPLKDDIKRDYPDIFEAIKDSCAAIFDADFPDEEIAYLVLHFAAATIERASPQHLSVLVICSSGLGTSKMVSSQLTNKISGISRIDQASLFELESRDLADYDLILSTIPLKDYVEKYTLISTILTEEDIEKINVLIKGKQLRQDLLKRNYIEPKKDDAFSLDRLEKMQLYSNIILNILGTFYIGKIEVTDKKAILSRISQRLKMEQLIHDDAALTHALLEREKHGGLGIPGTSLALYHTRLASIQKPLFQLYDLRHPLTLTSMNQEEMTVTRLVMMLSPIEVSDHVLEVLSFLSTLIIRDEASSRAFEILDEQGLKRYLSQELNSFINDKLS